MYLNNFAKAFINTSQYVSFSGTVTNASQCGGPIQNWSNSATAYYTNYNVGAYVDVGFGTTPATKDDYKLKISNAVDTPKLTFLSNGYVSTDRAGGTYPYIRNLTTTYINNTEEDVTITEVGYTQKGNGDSMPNINVLWTRTVLDTPIVVPAGKQVAITISLEM